MDVQHTTKALQQKDTTYLIHPLTALRHHEATGPLVIVRGAGSTVYDSEGHAFIDSLAGLWNCTLGHGRRDVIRAISEQMERIAFATTFFGISNTLSASLGLSPGRQKSRTIDCTPEAVSQSALADLTDSVILDAPG